MHSRNHRPVVHKKIIVECPIIPFCLFALSFCYWTVLLHVWKSNNTEILLSEVKTSIRQSTHKITKTECSQVDVRWVDRIFLYYSETSMQLKCSNTSCKTTFHVMLLLSIKYFFLWMWQSKNVSSTSAQKLIKTSLYSPMSEHI